MTRAVTLAEIADTNTFVVDDDTGTASTFGYTGNVQFYNFS